jgi:hypothetical protein
MCRHGVGSVRAEDAFLAELSNEAKGSLLGTARGVYLRVRKE